MGLMDRMMDRMIINLSVTEKEDLMIQLMPEGWWNCSGVWTAR